MPSEQGPARHNGVIGFQMAGVPLVAPVYKGSPRTGSPPWWAPT
ncbi:unnamed protein product [Penicillium nalgiovense]|nr:unnamed protein product [Penicillium nalgiovense]CAG7956616.1 unnamed protein product [Penicillium nalgiovense]CAG8022539.1 unnamed protein product [Penicillium nalgiovense]CAG8150032.1 unnamed protein product [Penicillium nalgiovense]CAG8354629.1 unnamed protein product [Penicillium nalgiovense]